MALTAVLLQAAIADPDLVQAHLADQACWPVLLAIFKPQPTSSETQHRQRLEQLGASSYLLSGGSDAQRGMMPRHSPSNLSSEQGRTVPSAQPPLTGSRQQYSSEDNCSQGCSQKSAATEPADEEFLQAGYEACTAGAASHVAQLITLLTQSQASHSSTARTYAGADALEALLHCYSTNAHPSSRQLPVPVWPAQAQRQRQQQAMLQHVAEAGGSLATEAHKTQSMLWVLCSQSSTYT